MSRCYPYPPPGYQKEVPADQPVVDIAHAATTQVTHKEKHKHRDKDKDKEKKKKRKREEKDDNAHKEKRSSKNHKTVHYSGVAHPGENGRVAEPSAFADNGQEGAVKASAPERESRPSRDGARPSSVSLQDGARISREAGKQSSRDGARPSSASSQDGARIRREAGKQPSRDGARPSSASSQDGARVSSGDAGKQDALHEVRISSNTLKASPRDVKTSRPAEGFRISLRPVEASRPVGKDAKASVSTARASVSSAGKAPTQEVKVSGSAGKLQEGSNARPVSQETRKSNDKTGKQRAEKPASTASTSKYVVLDKEINGKVPSLRTRAEQDQQRQQPEQSQKSGQPQGQQRQHHQHHHQQQQTEGPQQQAKEAHQRSGGGGVGGDSEKREGGSSEKREKRSRLSELKLPDVPTEVNNAYDDGYLEWLFPNKRRPEAKTETERAESSRQPQQKEEVWADAVKLSSVGVLALPYVVPE